MLPAWVAEMDFALAGPVAAALHEAVDRGAVGYSPSDARTGVAEALATFATERWAWALDPAHVVLVPDVMSGIELVLRTLCEDAAVVVPTPAYPPFLDVVPLTGRTLVPVPLSPDGPAASTSTASTPPWRRAPAPCSCASRTTRGGACSTGSELEGLRDVVLRHGARVISDEVHAPLVLTGATHVPYATLDGHGGAHHDASCRRPRRGTCPGCAAPRWSPAPRRTPARLAPCPSSPSTAPRRWAWSAPSRRTARARRGWRSCGDVSTATAPSSRASSPSCCRRCAGAGWRRRTSPGSTSAGSGAADPAGLALRDGRVLVNDGHAVRPWRGGHVRVNLATSPERGGPHRPAAGRGLEAPAVPMTPAGRRSRHRGAYPPQRGAAHEDAHGHRVPVPGRRDAGTGLARGGHRRGLPARRVAAAVLRRGPRCQRREGHAPRPAPTCSAAGPTRSWPATGRPHPADDPFTAHLNSTAKYVASTTLREVGWQRSSLLQGDVPTAVARLKEQPGGGIAVLGSGTLVQTLMQHNLVDEYSLTVSPLVIGSGARLFRDAEQVRQAAAGRLHAHHDGVGDAHLPPGLRATTSSPRAARTTCTTSPIVAVIE